MLTRNRAQSSLKIGILIFFLSVFSTVLSAQTISDISPKGERGASFQQTITVSHVATPAPNNDTKVVFNDSRIKWTRISESTFSFDTLHQGRITIPADVPSGSYRFVLSNSGFSSVVGYMLTREFNVLILSSDTSTISPGTTGNVVVLTLNTALSNYLNYQIQGVESNLAGVEITSATFLNSTQIRLVINVASNIIEGPLGLYIRFGKKTSMPGMETHLSALRRNINVLPTNKLDFSTIYLDETQGIMSIGRSGPTITSINPNTVARGEKKLKLNISGVNFTSDTIIQTTHSGVTFFSTLFLSENQLISYVTATDSAELGDITILARNGDGDSLPSTGVIRVITAKPVFLSASPGALAIGGESQRLCITGQNFTEGTYVLFDSDFITVHNTEYINSTQICVNLTVNSAAPMGPVTFIIYNPDGIYTEVENAIMLSSLAEGYRTIRLLYPGKEGGSPEYVDELKLSPDELTDTPYPVFRWFSKAQKYKISIYKPLQGQSSYQQIINNRPLHETYVYDVNYWQYPLYARELKPGIRYYWKVEAYFNTLEENKSSSGGKVGEILSSEIWSFVVRNPEFDLNNITYSGLGTLNPVDRIEIIPDYVEIAAGDRISLLLRAFDQAGNHAAFIPGYQILDYKLFEENYPDIRLLPKSFGRVELVVPNIYSNQDFQTRLMKNPDEFSKFPVLLYVNKNAKGVAALVVEWQNKKNYTLVNILPPKTAALQNGMSDRFNIGNATRLSETFEITMNSPFIQGEVISGSGKLFIDSSGFREKGNLPVEVNNIRLDHTGRAYTGSVRFTGKENITLAGFDLKISEIIINPDRPSLVKGILYLPGKDQTSEISFSGILSAFGEINASTPIERNWEINSNALVEKGSKLELDFSSYWSPEYKSYDPSFRGIIVPVFFTENDATRLSAISDPSQISKISYSGKDKGILPPLKMDIARFNFGSFDSLKTSLSLTGKRIETGSVILSWIREKHEIKSYNVYRRNSSEGQYRLIAERIDTDKFEDVYTEDGVTYWYKVTGMNKNNAEIRTSGSVKIESFENK